MATTFSIYRARAFEENVMLITNQQASKWFDMPHGVGIMHSANTPRYLAMARLERRLAYLKRAERTNGRIAMVAVAAATLGIIDRTSTDHASWRILSGGHNLCVQTIRFMFLVKIIRSLPLGSLK